MMLASKSQIARFQSLAFFFQLSDPCGSSGLNTSSMFFSVKVCKNEASISISELQNCANGQVLQAVLARYSIPDESFAAVCVIVDKVSAPTLLI